MRGTFAVVTNANVPRISSTGMRGTFAVVTNANVPQAILARPRGTFAGAPTAEWTRGGPWLLIDSRSFSDLLPPDAHHGPPRKTDPGNTTGPSPHRGPGPGESNDRCGLLGL